jgi:hypothetical protein
MAIPNTLNSPTISVSVGTSVLGTMPATLDEPELVSPINGDTIFATYGEDTLDLTWTATGDYDGFIVEVSESGDFHPWNTFYYEVDAEETSMDLLTRGNLKNDTLYYWRVCSTKNYICSIWSDVESFLFKYYQFQPYAPVVNRLIPDVNVIAPTNGAYRTFVYIKVDYDVLQAVNYDWTCTQIDVSDSETVVDETARLHSTYTEGNPLTYFGTLTKTGPTKKWARFLVPRASELSEDKRTRGRTYTITYTAENSSGKDMAKCDIVVTDNPLKLEDEDPTNHQPGQVWLVKGNKSLRMNIDGTAKNITIPKVAGDLPDAEVGDIWWDTTVSE